MQHRIALDVTSWLRPLVGRSLAVFEGVILDWPVGGSVQLSRDESQISLTFSGPRPRLASDPEHPAPLWFRGYLRLAAPEIESVSFSLTQVRVAVVRGPDQIIELVWK